MKHSPGRKAAKRAAAKRKVAKPAAARRKASPSQSYADFMAQAYAMELDAAERYAEFADQMEVHNNPEVAKLFRKLAEIEGLHARQILEEMGWPTMPAPVYALQWDAAEPPETTPVDSLHYRMRPWHALQLALDNERRAEAFLAGIAKARRTPAEVRKLALEMAADEREHQRLIREWMARVPKPEAGWERDPDPPSFSD